MTWLKKIFFFILITLSLTSYGQTSGFAESNGAKIFYRTWGSGTSLLIINGGPGLDSDGFADIAQALSSHNQTIIYDQRGTGKSVLKTVDSTTVTMDLMVEDMENLRKKLNIKQWMILGHSFGGMLASYYATIHPENIISLILSSSGGIDLELLSYAGSNINSRLTEAQLKEVNYWTKKINEGDTSYNARWNRAIALAPAYLYNKSYAPLIAKRLTQSNPSINNLIWQDLQKIKFDCAAKLGSFDKPVLIIQGKQDIVEERTAVKAHKALKNSRIIFLDKCVHYGWLDRRDAYLSEVGKFISMK
jgi:proline iminopeptidase